MENGRDERDEYEDQDAEPTMMAPPGQRPSDTGHQAGSADGAGSRGRADTADGGDADMDQEGDAKP